MNEIQRRRVLWAAIALPLIAYVFVLQHWAHNIPYNDDIPDILLFILTLGDASSFSESLQAVLAPHNDHRTSASRLIYALVYTLEGDIDFRSLTFVANTAIVGLFALLAYQVRGANRLLVLLILSLLLFQPRAFGPMFCVMCGFAFFYVNLYGLASLSLLKKPAPLPFLLAVVCAVLATYSLASGQLIWPAGLAWLLYLKWHHQQPWSYPLAWLAAAIICLYLYQYGWDKPNNTADVIELLMASPLFILRFGLAIAGSAFAWGMAPLAEAAGLILVAYLGWTTCKTFRSGLSPLHLFAWYALGQCFVIAMGRAPYAAVMDDPMFFAIVPRYSFISLCLVAPMLVLALNNTQPDKDQKVRLALVATLLFSLSSYWHYLPQIHAHWEHRLKFYNTGQYRLLGMPLKESNAIVKRAEEKGIYAPPVRPLQAGRPE